MSDAPQNGQQRPTLTTRQGHPVGDNQNLQTIGDRGPATLENYHFIEKISHFDRERIPERVVHARGATAFGFFEATARSATSRSRLHPRQALPGGRQAHRGGGALLHRGRRARLLRGGPRPARLRGQVLHRGRQLGPRRQQPRRVLHPRRHQVPGLHPLPEARPGDLRAPGAQPGVRLHQPDPRGDAHGHARLRPARHPGELPHHAGLRRQHLQVGQRRRRDGARQVPLAAQAGRQELDRGRRRGDAGAGARCPHPGSLRGDRARRPSRSGSCSCRS